MDFAQQRAAHSELLIRSQNKSHNITSQGGTAASAALRELTSEAGPVCPASGGFPGLKELLLPVFLGCPCGVGVCVIGGVCHSLTPVGAPGLTDLHYSEKARAVGLEISLFVALLQTDIYWNNTSKQSEFVPQNCVLGKIYTW